MLALNVLRCWLRVCSVWVMDLAWFVVVWLLCCWWQFRAKKGLRSSPLMLSADLDYLWGNLDDLRLKESLCLLYVHVFVLNCTHMV